MNSQQVDSISGTISTSIKGDETIISNKTNDKYLESNNIIEGPPKDKGYAWVILVACFINNLFSFGSTSTFGVFQVYYLKTLFLNEPAEKISWISTVCLSCTFCGGLLASPIIRYIGLRNTSLLGTVIATSGFLLASFSTQIWHLVLTQGIIYGLGCALLVNVSLTTASLWFDKHRNVAIGIVTGGGNIGSLLLVPIVTRFISFSTIDWAFRTLSILYFVFTGVCGFLIRPRVEFKPPPSVIDFSMLKDPVAIMIFLSGMIMQVGYNAVVLYFPSNLVDIGVSQTTASNLIMVFSTALFISRISTSYFSKRLGEINIPIVFQAITAIIFLTMWYLSSSFSVLLAFYILFGFFGFSFFALSSVIVAKYYPEEKVSQLNGLLYLMMGLAILIFVPSTEVIFQKHGNRTSYKPVILFSGVSYLITVFTLIALRILVKRNNPNFKKALQQNST
ncbi:putative transporter ESBP6 [Smittium culicis]|uniref:Putative transporter ESBP6 n=1 Tax=Smittium culicis TaxID=133412 RepID=A0A1R1YP21_9FUNG|nr:putative transporter ESBP6 [Smittium culicis]